MCDKILLEKVFGDKLYKGEIPFESVAKGAAIQGGILDGEVKDVLLLDVTPFSLGIEQSNGDFKKIIDRNTTIPTQNSEVFSFSTNDNSCVEINLLQGESCIAAENLSLGKFKLDNVSSKNPKIEVALDIDANSKISLSLKELVAVQEKNFEV